MGKPVLNLALAREEEFKRLDITGEGRLTFLTLKSALELRGVAINDSAVRKWLRDNDLGGKNYVDMTDFINATWGIESELFNNDNNGSDNNSNGDSAMERRNALRRTFERYDVDGDGYISVDDLIQAFQRQGRICTEAEAIAWVKKRDSLGAGGVNF